MEYNNINKNFIQLRLHEAPQIDPVLKRKAQEVTKWYHFYFYSYFGNGTTL